MTHEESVIEVLKTTIKDLKSAFSFSEARVLLDGAKHDLPEDDRLWVEQQKALCTYKDETLPVDERLSRALGILEGVDLRSPHNNNPETLSLGGAIYKRKWENRGRLDDLYESLTLYRAAFERNPEQDAGYGGGNAAFILQLLADRSKVIAMPARIELLDTMARLRARIVECLANRWACFSAPLRQRFVWPGSIEDFSRSVLSGD